MYSCLCTQWWRMERNQVKLQWANPTNKWFFVSWRLATSSSCGEGRFKEHEGLRHTSWCNSTITTKKRRASIHLWKWWQRGKWLQSLVSCWGSRYLEWTFVCDSYLLREGNKLGLLSIVKIRTSSIVVVTRKQWN